MTRTFTLNGTWCLVCSFVFFLTPHLSRSQEVQLVGELKQWHKLTFSLPGPLTGENDSLNPFTDVRLTFSFSHGARTYTVPGYYAADGLAAETSADTGRVWRAHFVPDAVGAWTYQVSFRTGPGIALSEDPLAGTSLPGDSLSGAFAVGPTDKQGEDLRAHGFLRYVDDHYLQFAGSGNYYIKSGTNSPENLLAYADFDGTEDQGGLETPGLVDGLHQYEPHLADWRPGDPVWKTDKGKGFIGALNYLASQGVNSIYFLTYNLDGGDGQDTYMWTTPEERLRFDCSKLDQWEIVFEHADSLGIQLHVVTQETENNTAMGGLSEVRRLYYRELVARFGHHLALQWNIGEENTNSDAERIAFANYLRALDPYDHPITVHTTFDDASTYYNGLLGQPSYEATSIQGKGSLYGDWAIELRARSAQAGRKWVIYGDEQGPVVEDDASNVDKLRAIYWESLLGGSAGCEWYFGYQDTFGDVQSEDFRGVEILWEQTTLARTFWQRYVPFQDMQPDNALSQNGSKVFAKKGQMYVLYVSSGISPQLNLDTLTASLPVKWFNPRTGGELQDGSLLEVQGPGWVDLGTPPAELGEDWVIVVGGLNRAPSFELSSSELRLDVNFPDPQTVSVIPHQPAPDELEEVITYSLLPDSVGFAKVSIDSSTGEILVQAVPDSAGTQLFQVIADDGQDVNNTYTQPFLLSVSPPAPPEASISASPLSGPIPLEVTFDAGASFDPNGEIVSYQWDFGDGANATGEQTSYTYLVPGTYLACLIATDEDGSTDTAFQEIVVEEKVYQLLYVVGSTNLNEGDLAVKTRLEGLGYQLQLMDDQDAQAIDAQGKDLVLISSSVSSGAVNNKFTATTTPVLCWESYLFDDLGMTGNGNGNGFGSEYGETSIEIVQPAHPMAAGLTGSVEILPNGGGLNWGVPSAEAQVIGMAPGNANAAFLFGYETGANMVEGQAPARRVGLFARDNSADDLNEEGWKLVEAAVCWAMQGGCEATDPPLPNQAPHVKPIPDQEHVQATLISLQVIASDPDGDSLAFVATGLPQGLSIDAASGEITGTIAAEPGTYAVAITVTDNGSPVADSSVTFSWRVLPVLPVAPVLTTVADQQHEEGSVISLALQAEDANGDILLFSQTGLPAGLELDAASGLISGTLTAAHGTYAVQVMVTEQTPDALADTAAFAWEVTEKVNLPPSLAAVADQVHEEGSSLTLALEASDPEGDTLLFSQTGLPAGLELDAASGLISGTLTAAPGTYAVQVMVTEQTPEALADTAAFAWEVTAQPEGLPQTFWLEAACAELGSEWLVGEAASAAEGQYVYTDPGFVTQNNLEAQHFITLEIVAGTAGTYRCWVRFRAGGGYNSLWQQAGNGWFKHDFPNEADWGWEELLAVELQEGPNTLVFGKREGVDIDRWVMSMEPGFEPAGAGELAANCGPQPNLPPELAFIPNQVNEQGDAVSLALQASDPNGHAVSFAATGLPQGLSLNPATGLITGVLTAAEDTYVVNVAISDGQEPPLGDAQAFTWTVTLPLPNQAPLCEQPGPQVSAQGSGVSLQLAASDPDGDALSFLATGLPQGLSLDETTGLISGTLTAAPGLYPVEVQVSDNSTPVESCGFSFSWEVAEAVVGGDLMMVVKSEPLNGGDAAVLAHLQQVGWNVEVVLQNDATASQADGKAAVLISSTVVSGIVGDAFTNLSVPVLCWEPYLFDDLQMTGSGFYNGYGLTSNVTQVSILDATHPLAAGKSGTFPVVAGTEGLAWGVPTEAALAIASVEGEPDWLTIFAYEQGASMQGLNAPERRLGLFLADETASSLTSEGWTLFDAALCWVTRCEGAARMGSQASLASPLTAFPNPFRQEAQVTVSLAQGQAFELRLMDMMGKLCWQLQGEEAWKGSLPVQTLPEGMYLLELRTATGRWTKTLLKQ